MSRAPLETEAAGGSSHHRRFAFDDFEVDLDRGGLTRHGERIPLRPKTFAILRYLIERAGTLVSRNELLDAVWPGVVVTDDSVAQCLIEIRRALGDDQRTMIRTVPRRGLIFDVPVRVRNAGQPPTPQPSHRNFRLEWRFGLALAALAFVLWWSSDAGRPTAVTSARSDAVNKPHPDAYRLVLQGQALYRQRADGDVQSARDLFRRAAVIDPDYALAWARLAAALRVLFVAGEIDYEELIQTGLPAATRALELRPDLAEVQFRAANYAAIVGDYDSARAYHDAAIRIDPGHPLLRGHAVGVALWSGDLPRAIEVATLAVQHRPLSPGDRERLVFVLFFAGRYDAMREQAVIAIRMNPDSAGVINEYLLQAAIVERNEAETRSRLATLPPGLARDHALALLAGPSTNAPVAVDAMRRLAARESVEADFRLAEAQAWSGDHDAAFASLARARRGFDSAVTAISAVGPIMQSRVSPFLAPLHDDPRWAPWLANLPLEYLQKLPDQGTERTVAQEGY